MALPNTAQTVAFARHILTFAAGGVTILAALHVLSGGDASSATQALNEIGDGVTKVIAGVGTLIGIVSGVYAAWSASPLAQLLAVSKNPTVEKVVVTSPAVANAVPSDKVTTN